MFCEIKLWKNYHCRYKPDYQTTLDPLISRTSTLTNLRNRIANGINHIRQDDDLSEQKSRASSFTLSGTQTTL